VPVCYQLGVVFTHSSVPVRCPGDIVDVLQHLKYSMSALHSSLTVSGVMYSKIAAGRP